MDLTPELFEKTEFTERRKGYDIEEVETFMEDAGTALAQLLVKVRHVEERASVAEGRLSEAETRAAAAETRAGEAQARAQAQIAEARSTAKLSEQAEVEQAARTLFLARKTAEDLEADARTQAQNLLVEAKTRADRQLAEAQAEAEELIRRARTQADHEFAERRGRVIEEVRVLESRRSQLADVMTQLEARLAGYREDLTRTAEELTLLASDPDRLGARPTMSIPPDEVVMPARGVDAAAGSSDQPASSVSAGAAILDVPSAGAAPVATAPVESSGAVAEVVVAPVDAVDPTASSSEAGADAMPDPERIVDFEQGAGDGPPTEAVEQSGSDWGPGSWSRLEASGGVDEPEATISIVDEPARQTSPHIIAEPVTGSGRDRYLQDLDEAVNVTDDNDDEAMTAFFEGSGDSRSRRFGWRR